MISLRWVTDAGLPVTIKPPLAERAKAATARSISTVSRASTGFNSTLNDGATAWIAANWPVPETKAGSRTTATRVTPGAISLSSSNHLTLVLYSGRANPVVFPPGPRQIRDEPRADRVKDGDKNDRHGTGGVLHRRNAWSGSG